VISKKSVCFALDGARDHLPFCTIKHAAVLRQPKRGGFLTSTGIKSSSRLQLEL
jgi:hypothetical protein